MAFRKYAFDMSNHKAITKRIMGKRFDLEKFNEVHRYIDGKGGTGHRVKHGHDEKAERAIRKRWGKAGVEIFMIHLIADRIYDDRFFAASP
jgi:hypothetical protein